MNSDFKLILISDNTDKPLIRYRKKNMQLWETLYLKSDNLDEVIDEILAAIKKKED